LLLPLELKLEKNLCTLYIGGHILFRMSCNHIEPEDVRETITRGEKRRNGRGPGHIYKNGAVEVVAKEKPCHCHAITIYNKEKNNNTTKDKNQRKRRYMEREGELACPRCEKSDLVLGPQKYGLHNNVIGEYLGLYCPNCRYICFDEKTSKEIMNVISKFEICPLTPEDFVLILLGSCKKPISGAILFMKEAFLLFEEKLEDSIVPACSPNFIPYHYGPYSFDIDEAWSNLEQLGMIKIEGRRSTSKEIFSLTEEGEKEAKKIFESLPEKLRNELPMWRQGLDQLGNDGILLDVYKKYPQYTDKSKIKDRVLPKTMHRRA
jgi:ssDNA-binding Zn-finger/Zn-ribbon topoisomerase 1